MPVVIDAGDGGSRRRRKPRREQGRTNPPPIPEIPAPPQLPAPQTGPVPTPTITFTRSQDITDVQRLLREPESRLRNILLGLERARPVPERMGARNLTTAQIYQQGLNPPVVTQESLPVAGLLESGQPPSQFFGAEEGVGGYEAALAEARRRAEEYYDPLNTIEAAAAYVATAMKPENNYSPPFIMYEVQDYFGWTDEEMKLAGYVRGLGGWTLDVGGEDLPSTSAGGGGGGGRAGGGTVSWSVPSPKNSFRGSSLINWRI